MPLKEKPINPEYIHRFDRATIFEKEGKWLHALQIYRQLIDDFPEEDFAIAAISNLYEKMEHPELGIEILEECLRGSLDNLPLRLFAGHYFFRQQAWKKTIELLAAFSPQDEPIIAFFVGYSYYMINDFQIAKHHFLLYINLHGEGDFLSDSFVYLAKACIQLDEYEEALEHLKKAEEVAGDYYELHLLFAIAYYCINMDTTALQSIKKSIKLNNSDPLVFEWAGRIAFRCGDPKKSISYYTKFLEKGGEINADFYANYGMAFLYAKDINSAKKNFDLALSFDPSHSFAKEGLRLINTEYLAFEK